MTDEMITLPLPRENAAQLHRAIESLRPVASRVQEPMGRLPSWQPFWVGSAATTAHSEVAVLTRLAQDITVQVEAARSGLSAYAAVVTATHTTVERLRQQWRAGQRHHESERDALRRVEAVQLSDPTGIGVIDTAARVQSLNSAWLRTRTDLLAQHGNAMRTLEAARSQCAATLAACAAGLPRISAANALEALLPQAWMPGPPAPLSEAEAWVAQLIARAGRPPSDWDSTEAGLFIGIEDRVTDPAIARALMQAIPPDELARFVERLWAEGSFAELDEEGQRHRRANDDALAALGLAMVVASHPGSGVAAPNAAEDSWREGWLASLAAMAGDEVGDRKYHPPFRGAYMVAKLLDEARRANPHLGPSRRFVMVVGLAMVKDEQSNQHHPAKVSPPVNDRYLLYRCWGCPTSGVDPLVSLLAALDGTATTAREFFLAPLDSDLRVIEYLIRDRVLDRRWGTINAVGDVLAQRLRETAAGASYDAGTSEDAVELAGLALNALGDTGAGWRTRDADERRRISSEINALRPVAADMLTRFPGTVTLGATRPGPESAAAVELKGHWFISIHDQQRMIDLLGQIALEGPPDEPITSPADSPGFLNLWKAVVRHQLTDVDQAIAGDKYRVKEAAMNRLGLVLGFMLGSGANAVLVHNGDIDDANQVVQSLTSELLSYAKVPGAIGKAGIPGASLVANKVLDFAKAEVMKQMAEKYPTDNAEKAHAASAQANRQTRQDTDVLVWDIVSAVGDWPPGDAPEVWAEAYQLPPEARFWGADGRPLPIAQLTGPGQLDAFQRWKDLVPIYQTLPMELRLGITEGVTNAG